MTTLFSPGLFGRLFTGTPSWTLTLFAESATLFCAGRQTALSFEQVVQGKVTKGLIWADIIINGHQLSGLTNERVGVIIEAAKELQEAARLLAQAKQRHAEEEKRRQEMETYLKAEFTRLYEHLPRVYTALETQYKSSSYLRERHLRLFLARWQNELALLSDLGKL